MYHNNITHHIPHQHYVSNIFVPFYLPLPLQQCQKSQNQAVSKPVDPPIGNVQTIDSSFLLDLQVLLSEITDIAGVASYTVRKLLLNYCSSSNEQSLVEIMDHAKKQITALTKNQLLSELENVQKIQKYMDFHRDCDSLTTILPLVQEQLNIIVQMINERVNCKLLENQGLGKSLLDERTLSLKSDDQLLDFLNALREKERRESVNLNFAPYRAQRVIAENDLDCTRRKICQIENELQKRKNRCLFQDVRMCSKEPYFDAFYL